MPSFPLPNCYQYTSWAPAVRIPTQLYNHKNATHLHPDDLFAHNLFMGEDAQRNHVFSEVRVGVALPSSERAVDLSSSFSATSSFLAQLCEGTAEVNVTGRQQQSARDDHAKSTHGTTAHDDSLAAPRGADDMGIGGLPLPLEASLSLPDLKRTSSAGTGTPSVGLQEQADIIPDPAGPTDRVLDYGNIDENVKHRRRNSQGRYPQLVQEAMAPSAQGIRGAASLHTYSDGGRRPQQPDGAATPDTFMQAFVGDCAEDREIIPLVNVSLDLSEVSGVNDPTEFLEEVEEITRYVRRVMLS